MADLAFSLSVNHDELEARLVVVQGSTTNALTAPQTVMAALASEKVTAGIDQKAILAAFERLPQLETTGETFVIARGQAAVPGKPGRVEYKVDVSGQPVYRAREDDTTVDFREATTMVLVKPGDLIAERIPPEPGRDGFNLTGKAIVARVGKPAALRRGEGVECDAEERYFRAAREGRPVLSQGVLSVSAAYEVPGDVDFNTGNIRFSGHVVVRGNVQDDFSIEAKSLEIGGVVGAATIRCEGPVTIRGGVNGRERAVIEAKGETRIKYINQARLAIVGNLVVAREIVNSRIWCRGYVRADQIIGGECLAQGGIEAKELGSDLGINTILEPGANFELRKIDEVLDQLGEKLEGLLRPIQPYLQDRARYKALPEDKKQEVVGQYPLFQKIRDAYLRLLNERATKIDDVEFPSVKRVVAWKTVHSDVFVRTELCMKQFKNPLTGPVALMEDVDSATIRPSPYAPRAEAEIIS